MLPCRNKCAWCLCLTRTWTLHSHPSLQYSIPARLPTIQHTSRKRCSSTPSTCKLVADHIMHTHAVGAERLLAWKKTQKGNCILQPHPALPHPPSQQTKHALPTCKPLPANLSYMLSCTNTRLVQMQVWPALRSADSTAPFAASSKSASSKTISGAFPPSSRLTRCITQSKY